jgi:hypothetical protein
MAKSISKFFLNCQEKILRFVKPQKSLITSLPAVGRCVIKKAWSSFSNLFTRQSIPRLQGA